MLVIRLWHKSAFFRLKWNSCHSLHASQLIGFRFDGKRSLSVGTPLIPVVGLVFQDDVRVKLAAALVCWLFSCLSAGFFRAKADLPKWKRNQYRWQHKWEDVARLSWIKEHDRFELIKAVTLVSAQWYVWWGFFFFFVFLFFSTFSCKGFDSSLGFLLLSTLIFQYGVGVPPPPPPPI